jgi:glycosyltransferase involved in cell wall biosynthesis
LVVDPDKPDEIADACDRLFRDTELAQEMGNRGITRLQQVYNREVWLDKIRAVYASCGVQLASR